MICAIWWCVCWQCGAYGTASADAYVTVGSDSTKLSVKAIGEMLDCVRESECFVSRNLTTTDTRTESNVKQVASALEMLRMSNIRPDAFRICSCDLIWVPEYPRADVVQ